MVANDSYFGNFLLPHSEVLPRFLRLLIVAHRYRPFSLSLTRWL